MTPTTSRSRSCVRRAATSVALAITALAMLFGVAAPASASETARTRGKAIAVEATRAIEALESWQATTDPSDYMTFVRSRDRAATLTALDLEIEPAALRSAWSRTDMLKQRVVLFALTQLGVPYRSMKSQPGVGFDCSGLTSWAFGQAGIEIPRSSGQQINAAEQLSRDEAEAGDLVHYPGHVSLYLGADVLVHARQTGSYVEATHLADRSLRFGDITGD
jgi:cell wall-associated NlpC family hydrolase